MSRVKELFEKKQKNILSVYCTAGFPTLSDTLEVMQALQDSGVDMIELGMPYSDPLADGPVIQASSSIALQNGMTIQVLFEQLKDFRQRITIPVLLMGYMNPVLQYGFEKFCTDAARIGIDGLIIPDLPEYEYEALYGQTIRNNNLDFVFLITPETSETRIRKLDNLSSGFLYAVSSSSTTGKDKNMNEVAQYLQRLEKMRLKNPVVVGFGIRDQQTFNEACQFANGAIIGTAFIKTLQEKKNVRETTLAFIKNIR